MGGQLGHTGGCAAGWQHVRVRCAIAEMAQSVRSRIVFVPRSTDIDEAVLEKALAPVLKDILSQEPSIEICAAGDA